MYKRSLALTVVLVLATLLSACSTLPSVLPPTAEPIAPSSENAATAAPVQPAATEPSASSPIPTPALTAPITATEAVTATSGAAPAVVSAPAITTTAPITGTADMPAATASAVATPSQAQERVVVPMVATGGNAASTEAAGAQAASAQAATTTYTVKQGDTLAKIAARFGVTVAAILKANPQITNPDHIYIGQKIKIPGSGGSQPPPATTTRVNIYMIGIGTGKVGCGDQVVAVQRDVPKTAAPLTAALNLLLSQKSQYYGQSGLYNALYQSNLSIASITNSGSAWTIRLTGQLRLGGVCDNPRVKAQLEQTALQFSTVKSVQYFVNGKPLDQLLSGK